MVRGDNKSITRTFLCWLSKYSNQNERLLTASSSHTAASSTVSSKLKMIKEEEEDTDDDGTTNQITIGKSVSFQDLCPPNFPAPSKQEKQNCFICINSNVFYQYYHFSTAKWKKHFAHAPPNPPEMRCKIFHKTKMDSIRYNHHEFQAIAMRVRIHLDTLRSSEKSRNVVYRELWNLSDVTSGKALSYRMNDSENYKMVAAYSEVEYRFIDIIHNFCSRGIGGAQYHQIQTFYCNLLLKFEESNSLVIRVRTPIEL